MRWTALVLWGALGIAQACNGPGDEADGGDTDRIDTVIDDTDDTVVDTDDSDTPLADTDVVDTDAADTDPADTDPTDTEESGGPADTDVTTDTDLPTDTDLVVDTDVVDSAGDTGVVADTDVLLDADRDGTPAPLDCDDSDPASTVVATDADCDGTLTALDCDDTDPASTVVAIDADCDGTLTALDCDDTDPMSTVVATDFDCDGTLAELDCDDSDPASTVIAIDADCDGALTAFDCDDASALLGDVALDADCDGVLTGSDCDDHDAASGMRPAAVEQIASLRALADTAPSGGTVVAQRSVTDAVVTAVRPLVTAGADPAGFYIQPAPGCGVGPAIFVAVDPATLSPAPVEGDLVRFTATAVGRDSAGVRQITQLTSFTRSGAAAGAGFTLGDLTQVASAVDFGIPSNVDAYESELVTLSGALNGSFSPAGAGYEAATMATTGTVGTTLSLRVPSAVRAALDLGNGCTFTLTSTPMSRFSTSPRAAAWSTASFTSLTCPAPRVVSATPTSTTSVVVTFDRALDAASVSASGAQFAFSGASTLTASAASLSGGREVTVTTSSQAAIPYTVAVATSVHDTLGRALDGSAQTASFTGFSCTPAAIVISQVYGGGGTTGAAWTNDFVELHNRSSRSIDLAGWSVQYSSAFGTGAWSVVTLSSTSAIVPAGSYFLVSLASGGTNGAALPTAQASGAVNLASTSGKVAVVNTTTALNGPVGSVLAGAGSVSDLVGYGTVNYAEGTSAPTLSTTTPAALRGGGGCDDHDDNAVDFAAAAAAPAQFVDGGAHVCVPGAVIDTSAGAAGRTEAWAPRRVGSVSAIGAEASPRPSWLTTRARPRRERTTPRPRAGYASSPQVDATSPPARPVATPVHLT